MALGFSLSDIIAPPVSPVAGAQALNQGIAGLGESIQQYQSVKQHELDRASTEAYQREQQRLLEEQRQTEQFKAEETARSNQEKEGQAERAKLSEIVDKGMGLIATHGQQGWEQARAGMTAAGVKFHYVPSEADGPAAAPTIGGPTAQMQAPEQKNGHWIATDRHDSPLTIIRPSATNAEHRASLDGFFQLMHQSARPEEKNIYKFSPEEADRLIEINHGNVQEAAKMAIGIRNEAAERQQHGIDASMSAQGRSQGQGIQTASLIGTTQERYVRNYNADREVIADKSLVLNATRGLQMLHSSQDPANPNAVGEREAFGLQLKTTYGGRPAMQLVHDLGISAGLAGKLEEFVNKYDGRAALSRDMVAMLEEVYRTQLQYAQKRLVDRAAVLNENVYNDYVLRQYLSPQERHNISDQVTAQALNERTGVDLPSTGQPAPSGSSQSSTLRGPPAYEEFMSRTPP